MKADIRRQRHEKVIAALLATSTREEAAEKLGINSRTIRRYFDDPEFLKLYTEATKGIISNSTQQIQEPFPRYHHAKGDCRGQGRQYPRKSKRRPLPVGIWYQVNGDQRYWQTVGRFGKTNGGI